MLVYFWIAHYSDGTSLPQFDPITYEENKFSQIDQEKLVKVGLYPFSEEFARLLREHGHSVESRDLPIIEVDIFPPRRLILYRTVKKTVSLESNVSEEEILYCIGYQITKNNTNFKSIIEVTSDGKITMR